jgi:ATP-dependent exoDNAse (exonuclease V) beta subunit
VLNFTVYKSSAGSGKTFTLVKEYLRLALDDKENPPRRYREILAITFTNKAAAEMKERIIRALKDISVPAGSPVPMAEMLVKELALDHLTLATRARDVLEAILHNYTDFAIGTIDSFTHRIVRAFAHDLHLPVNFEVEMDADKLIRQAVDILISRIGEDERLTEILVQFSETRADDERSWQIETDLRKISSQLMKEEGSVYAEKLRDLQPEDFLAIRGKLYKAISGFEEKVKRIASDAQEKITAAGLAVEDFAFGKNGIANRIKTYSEGRIDNFGGGNSNIAKTLASGKFEGGKVSRETKAAIDAIKNHIESAWNELEELRQSQYGDYLLQKMVLRNIYGLAVLNEIEKIIHSFRTENSIVHISVFNRIISRIVFEEPVPFIYERLGEKYANYLIDEFQDTSVVQWQNLLPLLDNALANGNFNMIVGDGKQAIYRWRGGDVEQFASLPYIVTHATNALVREREQSLIRNYNGQHLAKNFRSKAEIVNFNNAFFGLLTGLLNTSHQLIYEKLRQEFQENETGGYVRIEALPADEHEIDELFLAKTIERIQLLKQQGWQYQDIAVLTRRNQDGNLLAAALLQAGIPVLSTESLLLRQSPAVNFLVAMLRCIDHPSDELAGAQALEFLAGTNLLKPPLHDRLVEFRESGKRIGVVIRKSGIHFDEEKLARLSVYQRCEELIRVFGLTEKFDSYLLFFLDVILEYSHDKQPDKPAFHEWWADKSRTASVVVPEGMNAVNVMTIHKSKGLEFPVVILPFANWKFKNQKDEFWIDLDMAVIPEMKTALVQSTKELRETSVGPLYDEEIDKSRLDMLNVLYVAMTRAGHQLYIYTTGVAKEIKDPKNLDEIFTYTLGKLGFPFVDHVFETGDSKSSIFPNRKSKPTIRGQKIRTGPIEDRLKIRSNAADNWDISDPKGASDRGILLHKLFSGIEIISDLDEAVRELLQNGDVTPEESDELRDKAAKLMDLDSLKTCFSGEGKIRNEAEILLPDGTLLRPDRVVELEGKTIIVDYKTGVPDEMHKQQLNRYADALWKMGHKIVERKLVYTERAEIITW